MTTQTTDLPQAETSSGRVSGSSVSTRHGLVAEYLGIPFGALGSGRARFEPSRPPEPWVGIRACTQPGPAVPQNPDPFAAQAGLPQRACDAQNGLNLNIWTPQTDATALPVLVWVHGGANISGSNADPLQNGSELAAEGGLVVVSVNYRLGAFGFLWLEDAAGESGIGNAAIHDLLAALRWVQGNIVAFGGDPTNVTVAGQSAGAALVGTLLGVPSIAGLIRRAIMQSGTAERVHAPSDAAALTRELIGYLGINEADAADVLERSTDEILAAQAALVEAHQRDEIGLSITFRPVVDGALIPAIPVDAVRQGLGPEVDLLIGTNLDEASLFLAFGPPESAPGAFAAILEREIDRSSGTASATGVASVASATPTAAAAFRAALASDTGENPTDTSALEAFLSDRSYRQPSNRLLDARAEGATGTAACRSYSYLFTWPSPALNGRLGACHGVELPFVFGTLDRREAGFFAGLNAPRSLSSAMIAAWSAFARTGDPGTSLAWPAYELPTRTTMVWDEHPRLVDDPRAALRSFASTC